jgi:hypothetical protein
MGREIAFRQRMVDAGERVPRRDHEQEGDRADRLGRVAAARRTHAGRAHQQVGAALEQRLPGAREFFLYQAQPRLVGHAVEGPDVVHQRARREHRIDRDRELGLPAGRHPPHPAFEIAGGFQQVASFLEQFGAGFGQFDARAEAFEQLHAQVLLEFRDGVGDRGRHPEQLLGGGREGAAAGDGVDGEQGVQAEFEHAVPGRSSKKPRSLVVFGVWSGWASEDGPQK